MDEEAYRRKAEMRRRRILEKKRERMELITGTKKNSEVVYDNEGKSTPEEKKEKPSKWRRKWEKVGSMTDKWTIRMATYQSFFLGMSVEIILELVMSFEKKWLNNNAPVLAVLYFLYAVALSQVLLVLLSKFCSFMAQERESETSQTRTVMQLLLSLVSIGYNFLKLTNSIVCFIVSFILTKEVCDVVNVYVREFFVEKYEV